MSLRCMEGKESKVTLGPTYDNKCNISLESHSVYLSSLCKNEWDAHVT